MLLDRQSGPRSTEAKVTPHQVGEIVRVDATAHELRVVKEPVDARRDLY